MNRRHFSAGFAALLAPYFLQARAFARSGALLTKAFSAADWNRLEASSGGRLGAAVLDTGAGEILGYRLDERFPMCSTFKCIVAAYVLHRAEQGRESLARRVRYGRDALLSYAPVASKHVGDEGMTVAELCEAAITVSDNTAANLLLDSFGGPPALTTYIRSLGDSVTRLDRIEPLLNESLPGDPRDTTSPRAMVGLLRKVVLDDALAPGSRAQLAAWLQATTTGNKRLRAGVPADWKVGDKTGTGERGSTCDVAVMWPPGRAPLVVAVYLTDTTADAATRDATLAQVGQLAAGGAQ